MAPINRERLTLKITRSTNKMSLVKLKTKAAKKGTRRKSKTIGATTIRRRTKSKKRGERI